MFYSKQILIILLISFSLPIKAQSDILKKRVTISIENKPVKDILLKISETNGIGFSYSDEVFSSFPNKSVVAKEKPLKDVLNELFAGEKVSYKVVGKQIVILVKNDSPKNFTINGYVKEQGSSETLIGVTVYVPSMQKGTASNTYGFYSLTLPILDTITVVYSFVGYKPVAKKISAAESEINIFLEPGTMLNEVVVNAELASRSSEKVQMSSVSIPVSQIKNVPSLLGEKDVFKVLQLMPGVQKGMEGSSGLYVRGGGPDQNLIILDDAIVYNSSHLFGFFSLFNGDALKSVELTKGGFPARYGGRLSSVIDMNMKEGNKEAWHGEGGVGLISSRLTVEGPLKKNKSSILLSGRRTYLDFLLRPLTKSNFNGSWGYYFYDFNAKINYDFGRKNKLYLSGYFGKDMFSIKKVDKKLNVEAGVNWGNATGTLRWNHLFNDKVFVNTSLIYSNYLFKVYDHDNTSAKGYFAEYNSGIKDYTGKIDFDYFLNSRHYIKTGLITTYHVFTPYVFVEKNDKSSSFIHSYQNVEGFESGLYAEDTYQPLEKLKINAGLRYSFFTSGKKIYHFGEPRLSAAYRIKNGLAIKMSYAAMNQYIHLLSNTGVSLPTDLWIPSNKDLSPQRSRQIAIGFVKDYTKPLISLSLEGYYKKMDEILAYKEGASYLDIDKITSNDITFLKKNEWSENVTNGRGWSYGIELLLQKKSGKFNGWIGYTLSWTQMQFDSLNFSRKFYAKYDRRHDISLVGIYNLSDRITLSAIWVYGTGNAITLPASQYNSYTLSPYPEDLNNSNYQPQTGNLEIFDQIQNIENKNNFRMNAYHRLDVGIQFHKKKKRTERVWDISVYNVYNHKNPFFYYASPDGLNTKLKQVSLYPFLPSVTYSIKF